MKKKIKFFLVLFTGLAIVTVGYIFWSFYKTEKDSQKFIVSLTGEFSPSVDRFQVKGGAVIFNVLPRNGFLLDYGGSVGCGTFPWEDIIFVTASFNGVTKKFSSENCWMTIPRDGELTLAVSYNPKYFNPEQVEIFTGVRDNSPTGFVGGYLLVKILQYKSGDEIGKIPEVEDIPKQQESIKIETGKLRNYKKVFLGIIPLPDLSESDLSEDKKSGDKKVGLFDPLSLEKQQELKKRWDASSAEGARLWKNFFSPDKKGEEGEKK